MRAVADWIRGLPERHGRRTLIALGAILLVGFVARAYVVVNPVEHPADDSRAYYALAKALYTEGSFGGPEFQDSSDWSPGAPLLYAAAFYLTGGAREGTARIVEALCGLAAILVVYALGRRLGRSVRRREGPEADDDGPSAGVSLFAAAAVAVYPPFIHSTGELMSEPPAILTLPAAILAFLWASERERPWYAWLAPGALFGLTAMFRPEYLLVGSAFAIVAAFRPTGTGWERRATTALVMAAGVIVVILPWTIRNQVVLDRTVPISTGGGKALYVGSYLPADGEYQRVKAILVERYQGRELDPHSQELEEVDPTPLFNKVAAEYPDLPRDEALGKIGKENLSDYFSEDPLEYAAMTVRKVGRMWSSGVGEAMSSTPGRVVQIALVALGIAGFLLLGLRRRWWELVALATPIVLVTAVGAVSLAAPRRNEVLMTLVFPLAGLALFWVLAAISSGRSWRSPQASSPPS
ncbi:MAG TPA: glycosyltransferase family 39 protein [Solirubrobacterales bacterium]|nr:glycosyltransferase family 39 protein [Solirubrobacterales bacterium]